MQELADQLAVHFPPAHPGLPRALAHRRGLGPEATRRRRRRGRRGRGRSTGRTYLPRKFKFGIGLPGDNSADIYSQDLGLLAVCEDYQIVGYNVLVGGWFGTTPSAKKTFPAVAMPMCFVAPEDLIDVAHGHREGAA